MPNEQKNNTSNKNSLRQDRYEKEIEGVSMDTLKAGLWLVKNRRNLWRIFLFSLIAISVISWVYTLYGFGSYLLVGMNNDAKMIKNLVQSNIIGHDYLVKIKAKDLIYSSTGILNNEGKYDLYAQIKNPNAKHWGSFSYCFTTSGGEKSCGKDFILPGEQKYILALAQSFKNKPTNITFLIINPVWQRLDSRAIPDWNKYRADHLNISINTAVFTPAAGNEISEKINLNTLSFTAVNNSAFSYWEAPLTIILSSGGKIVSLNRYVIDNFASYDSREIKITWPGIINSVNSINITPDINIIDGGVYRQPNE